MMSDSMTNRLARIELTQKQHGEMLLRQTTAIESIAVISERMANHIEDSKRLHHRVDGCEEQGVALKTELAELKSSCRDSKRFIAALLSAAMAGAAWLLVKWVERR